MEPEGLLENLRTLKTVDSRYQIKDKILGKGSFATTFATFDSKAPQLIACKMIIKKELLAKINESKHKTLTKEYFINALKSEVKTWKGLSHPNVVKFLDFSETSNNIYFFLEYCSQGNLETELRRRGHLDWEEALPIFSQLAAGAEYLYEEGIFHRDLKPENILLTHHGSVSIAKITDFGFAKVLEDERQKENPLFGTCVGTPVYMSPQVLLGEPYTIKCDVWSLGVMFYKVLYNVVPWDQIDNIPVLIQKMAQPLVFSQTTPVPPWLKELLQHMLQLDELKRPSIKQVNQILAPYYPPFIR